MFFDDIVGQEEIKDQLRDMVQSNRLSHALLLLGKDGSGGLALALAFSQYIVCEKVQQALNPVPQGPSLFGEAEPVVEIVLPSAACGSCAACTKATALVHPDIHYSYPVIPKKNGDKPISTDYITQWRSFIGEQPYGSLYDWLQFIQAENKQGNITSEECNEIIRKLSLKTFESKYKILIMWMPEMLGKEGNKLLKLIEEPPPNTLFLLVAESEALILPTILSRCQLVRIPPLSDLDVSNALIAKRGLDEKQARQIAAITEGNYREALAELNHAGEDWQLLVREWLNAILKNGPVSLVKWIEDISKQGREKQKQFLRFFNHLLQQSIRIRILGENSEWASNLPVPEKDFILRINKMADLAQQEAIVEELDKAAYYIERNANAKMLFHALSLQLFHILRDRARVEPW
jgi:DNA polymerase-3 subunit delta'